MDRADAGAEQTLQRGRVEHARERQQSGVSGLQPICASAVPRPSTDASESERRTRGTPPPSGQAIT